MTTTSGSQILARDFSNSMADNARDEWTYGKMRHTAAALRGSKVAIVTDKRTGHTLVNVEIIGVREGLHSSYPRFVVRSTHSDGTTHSTAYLGFECGGIIEIESEDGRTGAKWAAMRSYREESTAAILLAQSEHGEVEGNAWGKWDATPGRDYVDVTYTPHTGNPAFADKWGKRGYWRYTRQQLEATANAAAAKAGV